MALIEQFNPEERAFLAALPYRVGLWISRCDSTGGEEAEQQELQALETIVITFAQDFCKSEFVEELMRQTVAQKEQWPQWQGGLENMPADCRRAVDLLAPRLSYKDVGSFKHTLLEIADAVAKAYREEEPESMLTQCILQARFLLDRWQAQIRNRPARTLAEYTNISKAERAALAALTGALKPEEDEGQEPQREDSAA